MVTFMVIASTVCISGGMFALGRWHGYETSEKHYREAKNFWKEVEKRGL